MKIAVFDVSNGSCALAVCSNGYSVMFDCGSHAEKSCPVERINGFKMPGSWLGHMKNFQDGATSYPLSKLVVSHPDLDHIKNIQKVHTEFTPYLLHRRYLEEFPLSVVHQEDENYGYYRDSVCGTYRQTTTQLPNWGFVEQNYMIPMDVLKTSPSFGEAKMKNNSSIIYFLEYQGFRILFCGDMEEVGWIWLIKNNQEFKDELSKGVDVIVASHHGHTSGYSQDLMDLIGTPRLAILSKGSETGGETDVDCRYSATASGCSVEGLSVPQNTLLKKTLTTRSNGNIYIDVGSDGVARVFADMVS